MQHFKGRFEVEFKYNVQSIATFKRHLANLTHQIRFEDNQEHDWYFDTPDNALKQQDKSLILRLIEPENIALWIVKGPGNDCCEATDIQDLNAAKNMLQTMGYRVCLKVNKTRSMYFVGHYHITLDHLEGLGDFAEFAIMTNDESALEQHRLALVDLAAKFELADNHLQSKSYRTLVFEQQTNLTD